MFINRLLLLCAVFLVGVILSSPALAQYGYYNGQDSVNQTDLWFLWLLIPYAFGFGIGCYFLAREKNRDERKWALLGFLLGVFAFFALLGLEKLSLEEREKREKEKKPGFL